MQFLNPAFLGALALLGIPILLHLIRRRNLRVIKWAAWEFLLLSQKRTTKRVRLEQLILMLVRVSILLCAVLAFARPVLRTFAAPLLAAGSSIHLVIVLDNSFSMGFETEGGALFSRAQAVALDVVRKAMRSGDRASVVLQSSHPEALIRSGSHERNHVADTIRQARVSDFGTDHGKTAAVVAEILGGSKGAAKEVYWITDSRMAGLEEADPAAAKAWKEIAASASVTWIDVARGSHPNRGVGAPRLSRELVTPHAPVRIEATIRNSGGTSKPGALAHLEVEGKRVGTARVDLPSSGAATVSFVHLFERPGVRTGSVILEEQDGLRGDNASRFAARVVEALKVLVLNPQPGKTPATDEAFYLTTALDPEGAGSNKPAPIRATIRSSAKLSDLNLDGFDCIVLSGGGGFEPLDLRALREYLRRGGGLLVFPGQTRSAASLGRELADVLPASLGAEKKAPQGSPFRLDSGGISHPALQPLKDPEAVDLGAAAFESVFDMQLPSPPEGSRVLLRLAGGAPALAEREFGQGRVILASFSAGVSRGDFALRPAYLPLLHQLVAHLAAGNSLSRSLRTGDPIAARFDVGQADEPVRVSGPGGLDATLAAEVGGDGAIARLPMSRGAGIYRFEASGGKQEAFAVNVPEAESNLSHAGPNEVRERTGLKEMRFATDLEDIAGLADRARKGSEVWRPLILAAILLLFAEAFLAQRFGRRTIG